MSTKKEKCNHDEFAQGQVGEECLECGLLRSTIENIGGHSQSESIEWEKQFDEVYNSLGLDHVESFGKRSNRETLKCYIRGYIWDSITTAVSKRDAYFVEEVRKKATISEIAVSNIEVKPVKLVRLDDVLSILKH